jgi:hypothetical protein
MKCQQFPSTGNWTLTPITLIIPYITFQARCLSSLINHKTLLPAPFILCYLSMLLAKIHFAAFQSHVTPTLLQKHVRIFMHSTKYLAFPHSTIGHQNSKIYWKNVLNAQYFFFPPTSVQKTLSPLFHCYTTNTGLSSTTHFIAHLLSMSNSQYKACAAKNKAHFTE